MKYHLIAFVLVFLTTPCFSQFGSIYEAEDYVIGTWIPLANKQNSNSFLTITIEPDQFGSTLKFYGDHTVTKVLGKAFENKVIEGVWEVERNDEGEYNIKATMGKGFIKTTERFHFDGYDYLIGDFREKYRKK